MDVEYIKNNYHFETLTEEHDLSDFSCDSDDLNDFLKNDALPQQKEKLNITKLCVCEGEIVGFVSLLTDVLKLKLINDEAVKLKIKNKLNISSNNFIPAVKIGRFAIDKKYSKKGLGSYILKSIIINLNNISEDDVGFRFVVVEGYITAYHFYVDKNNFKSLVKDRRFVEDIDNIIKRNPQHTLYLYYDLNNLKRYASL